MSFPVPTSHSVFGDLDRPFSRRAAFLLNANARAVNDRLIEDLAEIVPAGDLFLSRTLEDAEIFVRTIARRGYGQLFLGGGDGTLVTTMALLRRVAKKEGLPMPAVGVLRLGTGNAMARALGAQDAVVDAYHVVQKGAQTTHPQHFVETEEGELTPFAGMGYDGVVLNDYYALRKKLATSPLGKRVVESVWGYLAAMLVRSVPSQIGVQAPVVRVTSKQDAIRMVHTKAGDVEEVVPAGTVLFEGKAPIISIGSIPYFGYGFTMFPFATKKPGYLQLRVGTIPLPIILAKLFPSIWHGTFRYPTLTDLLVKDVVIESDTALPYQVGGDAHGVRQRLAFRASEETIPMVELAPERLVPAGHTVVHLGPARMLLRLPR